MTTKTKAELEKKIAELAALEQAEQKAEAAASMQAQARIQQRKGRIEQLGRAWNAIAAASMPWNIIHEMAGKRLQDPEFMLGLVCFAMVNPWQPNTNESTWRGQLSAYLEAWDLGIDPAKPELNTLKEWTTLQAEQVAYEQEEAARRQSNFVYRKVTPAQGGGHSSAGSDPGIGQVV
jgi:methionyl-tRNA synthetase